jgi:tetratricopeptide (TPR) repeat protein
MSAFCQNNLILLISQPRAGSTLTQRILGGHPEIHTISEPWIMLHPLYALRSVGYQAEYSIQNSKRALDNFLRLHPNGDEAYFQAVRQMALGLYGGCLKASGKSYFLDKTPRYYYILPELYRTFPNAKYILLLRNPLAVFCSIFRTFIQEHWWKIQYYQGDLLRAPNLIARGLYDLQTSSVVLRYEDLLIHPEEELQRVCHFLDITCDINILKYGQFSSDKWQFGDQSLVYQASNPISQCSDHWQEHLQNPIIWKAVYTYLEFLGEDLLAHLGYDYKELKDVLDKRGIQTQVMMPPALQEFFDSSNIFSDERFQSYLGVVGTSVQLSESYLDLGKALLLEKQFNQSLKYLNMALQIVPSMPDTHYLLGEVFLGLGQLDQAILYYQKAIQLGTPVRKDYLDTSRLALQQALQLNPTHQIIADLLETL